ncbi:putative VQ motif-containing protein [Melia azedarach]|uniref:VQ motif-containing protein n=1 Tax=Melia azedarach TaxID=155640 RepID=A0ACC1Y5K0_MELAZ|nr:putative VQ motif-containing protein [Melia azedarach]
MASSSNSSYATSSNAMPQPPPPPLAYGSDATAAAVNTTFVQADPSTFRTIVQKLTGAPDDPSTPKLPVTHPARPISTNPSVPAAANIGPKRPTFKLHERRQTAKKLEIKLNNTPTTNNVYSNAYELCFYKQRSSFLVSPVSTLEFLTRVSPRSPREEFHARGSPSKELCEEEEEKAIAEKGFYLHPSPLSTPRGAEPELLPLFPLASPRAHDADYSPH